MNSNLFIHLKKLFLSPLVVGILFFLFLQLQLFNLGLSYRDEGYLLNNAQRINNGEMPYIDFSLALTPGSFYIQAFIMKIFGDYVVTDRILYILCIILILILSSRLFKLTPYLNYIFLMSLGIIYARKQSFASYNIEGLVFIIISLLLFDRLRNNKKLYTYAFFIGLINSIVFIIKQSYGGVFLFTFLILIIFFTRRKYLVKNLLFYIFGSLILPGIFFLLFYFNGALNKLTYEIFYFASSVKSDRMPFILTSLLFIPFLVFIVNFIKKFSMKRLILVVIFFLFFFFLYIFISPSRIHYLSSFYKDPSVYYFLFFFIAPIVLMKLFLKSKNEHKKHIVITSVAAISLFLASASSGKDYTTVIVTAPLYIPLFLYFIVIVCKKYKLPLNNIITTLLLVVFILPSVFYLIETYRKLYGIGYKKEVYANLDIKEAKYISIPIDQKSDLEFVINYVKNTTLPNDKIFCIPYCPFIYHLSKRNNASYFGLFYKFKTGDQARVIKDINNKNSIVLVQKPGPIEREANYEDENINVIKLFIFNNYKLIKTTQNFYIYRN